MTSIAQPSISPHDQKPGFVVTFVALGFFFAQVLALPAADSMFRTPKLAVALCSLAVASAIGFTLRLRAGQLLFPTSPLALVVLTLPLLQLLSIAWSADPQTTLARASVTTVWAVGAMWLVTIGQGGQRRIVRWAGWGAGASLIMMIGQALGFDPLNLDSIDTGVRQGLAGLAGNPSDAAMASALMLPLILFDSAASKSGWKRWILPGLLVLAIILSESITGYLALTLLAASLMASQNWSRRHIACAAIAAAALIIVMTLTSEKLQSRFDMLLAGHGYQVMSARADGWTAAAQMIIDHPVAGVGAGHYSYWFYPNRLQWLEDRGELGHRGERATHFEWAHCDPLELIAELGLIGIVWLLACGFALIRLGIFSDQKARAALAVALPFFVTHYPSHIAVAAIPLCLILAQLIGRREPHFLIIRQPLRVPLILVIIMTASAVVVWQGFTVYLSLWQGKTERRFAATITEPRPIRLQSAEKIEDDALSVAERFPSSEHWILPIVGRSRLLREDPVMAEVAFRAAYAARPHEEAEFGIAMALAAQNRQADAVTHLLRVCRINPAISRKIPDPVLRQKVMQGLSQP